MIAFNQIPVNLRVPGVYVEFDARNAVRGLPGQPHRILVLGQRLVTGTAAALELKQVTRSDEAVAFWGQGSMLARAFAALRANNRTTEAWGLGLDDDGAAVAATGTVTVGGAVTAAGTLSLYVAGERVRVAVASGAVLSQVAIDLAAAINAALDLPVTAAVNGGVPEQVDLTARNAGEVGNAIDVRVNYQPGEELPAGLTVAIGAMAGGAANPDLAAAIAALGDEQFHTIVLPYTDATGLTAIETELADRWGPLRPIEGHAIAAAVDTFANLSTLGNSRNSPHVTLFGVAGIPTLPYELAAAAAGQIAAAAAIDPARPFQTLPLVGVLAPDKDERFTLDERNLLLFDGVSTINVDTGGVVRIERTITTYKTSPLGAADESYLDANTLYTLAFLRFSLRNRLANRYLAARSKLARDGTRFGAGQRVATPRLVRGEVIALFRDWETAGLVENFSQFKEDLVVEVNESDPNRVDILLPPDLINQLRVIGAQIAFRR